MEHEAHIARRMSRSVLGQECESWPLDNMIFASKSMRIPSSLRDALENHLMIASVEMVVGLIPHH